MATRLSSPLANLKRHYTAVVIGSGYGGGIAASRLARAGKDVCLLERGKEFQPGTYPDTAVKAVEQVQVNTPECQLGSETGLYRFHVNQDIDVLVGCGLGGTSLINANVALRAEDRVFQDPCWPRELRQHPELIEDGYRRAEEMLKPVPYPAEAPSLAKMEAQEKSAAAMGAKFSRLDINVNFQEGTNHVGVHQSACSFCGDCVSGCNYGAKNTTQMNYLPDAHNHGAEIYTEVEARSLEPRDGQWVVRFRWLKPGREKFGNAEMFVTADLVVLAAGTLGSTEILLRSKQRGLPLSNTVGKRFTGNGDVLGFAYNCDDPIHGIGFGHAQPGKHPPVGPCITSVIDLRNQPVLNDGMIIEEGSFPGALAHQLPGALATAAVLEKSETDPVDFRTKIRRRKRKWESLVCAYHGAVDHTQIYLVMTHDDGNGEMSLQDDRIRLNWSGVGSQPIFERVNERLKQTSTALNGIFVHNPAWTKWLHKNLITVHPLGGAVMAESAEVGVVNHKGQVFNGPAGSPVYDSLYVADGSVIPRSLGVNPLLTISAIAERTCAIIAKDRGWTIDYSLPSAPRAEDAVAVGIEFTETMKGFISLGDQNDYQQGFDAGRQQGSSFEFTLTITSEDMRAMLNNPDHQAEMAGTATALQLSSQPMTVSGGKFNLFVNDPQRNDTRLMKYGMVLESIEGETYYFEGFKIVRKNPSTTIWSDTSTLYVTIYGGPDAKAPVLAKGILHIHPKDFAKQLGTIKVMHAASVMAAARAMLEFGRFFCRSLWEIYGPHVLGGRPKGAGAGGTGK